MIYKIVIGVLVIIILFLLFFNKTKTLEPKEIIITDTVFVDKIKIVEVVKEVKTIPNKIKIQRTTNKAIRDSVIKRDIIIGVKVDNSTLVVQSIDTTGLISESEYQLENKESIAINSIGDVSITEDKKAIRKEKRKKVIRKIGIVTLTVVSFIIGAMI